MERVFVDCRGELLQCPVGETEAGIQEHPALVIWSQFCGDCHVLDIIKMFLSEIEFSIEF